MGETSTVAGGDRPDSDDAASDAGGDEPSGWRRYAKPDPDERLGTKATLVGILFFGGGGVAFLLGAMFLIVLLIVTVLVGIIHLFIWTLTLGMLSPFDGFVAAFVFPVLQSEIVPMFGAGGLLWAVGYGIVRARWWGWWAGLGATGLAVAGLLYTTPTPSLDLVGPLLLAAVVAWALWDERYAYGIGDPND